MFSRGVIIIIPPSLDPQLCGPSIPILSSSTSRVATFISLDEVFSYSFQSRDQKMDTIYPAVPTCSALVDIDLEKIQPDCFVTYKRIRVSSVEIGERSCTLVLGSVVYKRYMGDSKTWSDTYTVKLQLTRND